LGNSRVPPQEKEICISTGGITVKRIVVLLGCAGLALLAVSAFAFSKWPTEAANSEIAPQYRQPVYPEAGFDVQVLVNGRPLDEYVARGKNYVEAIAGAEYELRIRNPLPYRVAVALSVDGLNTIDAQHTTAWNASKWVIEPYSTISVSGWQMSSERARQFYFTSERDSYGAKLGQTSNLGNISAVFFRERRAYPVPIAPPPHPRPYEEDSKRRNSEAPTAGTTADSSANAKDSAGTAQNSPLTRKGQISPQPDDEYAATGIGRSVQNDVHWVNMELDSRPAGEVMIRYEYYPALVRLGVLPRSYPRPDPLRRRERASGFEDRRYSREP
jgi:hypothetical protein